VSDFSCIIVEDEPLAAKVLADYIGQVPFLQLEGSFRNAMDANKFFNTTRTDILFLDINLPKLQGFEFLASLENKPVVIVTTAHHEHALQAFDMNVADYLLKPIRFDRFMAAVNKATARVDKHEHKATSKEYFFVNEQHRKVKLSFSEILYIESQKEYVKIVSAKRTVISKMSTSEVEKILPVDQFTRIHRSFIVALNKIDAYTADSVEIGGKSIPVGRNFKDGLNDLFQK